MILEYLFSGDEYRAEVEQYENSQCQKELYNIENTDCWIVSFSKSGENESSARVLSSVHEYMVEHFNPTTLSNESSAYFNKALFPHFNGFERKLRKLLYMKSAMSQNVGSSSPIEDLESKDFGTIFEILFCDEAFVSGAKKAVNGKSWKFTKFELLEELRSLNENTLWDRLIGKDSVPLLRSEFASVRMYRNDVMHAHSMSAKTYNNAAKLIKSINEQLDEEIGKIIGVKENALEPNDQDFNSTLSSAIRSKAASQSLMELQNTLAALQSSVPTINTSDLIPALTVYKQALENSRTNAFQSPFTPTQWDSIQQSLKAMSKIQVDISPALAELQKITASVQANISPEIVELQKSLQAFKLDPSVTKWIQELKDTEEDN